MPRARILPKPLAAALALAILAGCGGGGSDPEPVAAFPVAAVVRKLATQGFTFTGTNPGTSGPRSTTLVYAPTAPGMLFERQQTFTNAAGEQSSRSSRFGYEDGAGGLRFTTFESRGISPPLTETRPLPATVAPDASTAPGGAFKPDLVLFSGAAFLRTMPLGYWRYDWTLERKSDTTAEFCLSLLDRGEFVARTAIDCFVIDGAGRILKTRVVDRTYGFRILNVAEFE